MTFKGVALELEGAFVFGTAPRYVILNLIQDPFRRLKAAFTSGTHPSIGAWIPDRRSAPSGMTV